MCASRNAVVWLQGFLQFAPLPKVFVIVVLGALLNGCNKEEKPTPKPRFPPHSSLTTTTAPPLRACKGGSESCWRNKVIYQILTDRFKRSSGDSQCEELDDYCGGSYTGIAKELEYIVDLGAQAIWLSPVFKNAKGGYTGMWTTSLEKLNSHFGSSSELMDLIEECHKHDLLVLVSFPVNSMGRRWSDIENMDPPFNDVSNYHDCKRCLKAGGGKKNEVGCNNKTCECSVTNWTNIEQLQYCQIDGRPDLNPDMPEVIKAFERATRQLVHFGFDGLVLDDTMYTSRSFVEILTKVAGVFTVGDMYSTPWWVPTDMDLRKRALVLHNELHSTLNLGLYQHLRDCFLSHERQGLDTLSRFVIAQQDAFGNSSSLLFNFLEGLTVPRVFSQTSDFALVSNLMLYILTAEGVPAMFYGIEQEFSETAPTLWTSQFSRKGRLYKFIEQIGRLRKAMAPEMFSDAPQKIIYHRSDMLVFSRGMVLVVITNRGSAKSSTVGQWVDVSSLWSDGVVVCNLMWFRSDCLTVESGHLNIVLNNGEGKLYAPPANFPTTAFQCKGGGIECWKSKFVYQIITDRFATPSDDEEKHCEKLDNYCGGTFTGIMRKLDYIQGLGVEAIWISPVLKQVPKGYRGYWPMSLYRINEWFGTPAELRMLVQECHKRGMLFMVDVTANSMGHYWYDIPRMDPPFDSWQVYHHCDECQAAGGGIGGNGCNSISCDCWISDFTDRAQCLTCQLFGLPDVDTDDSIARAALLRYVQDLIKTYDIDGVRLDAVRYVPTDFWHDFTVNAGVFAIGEVEDGNDINVVKYVDAKAVNSTLNYPLYYQLVNVFMLPYPPFIGKRDSSDQTYRWGMDDLHKMVKKQNNLYGPEVVHLLGNFVSNHDQMRLQSKNPDIALRRNMIMYLMTGVGMPMLYYGLEQDMAEADRSKWGDDASTRPLWDVGYNTSNEMYKFVATLGNLRRSMPVKHFIHAEQQHIYASWDLYVFARGKVLVAITNLGSLSPPPIIRDVDVNAIWPHGTKLCNLFARECLTVEHGHLRVRLDNGEGKVFAPEEYLPYLWKLQSTPPPAEAPTATAKSPKVQEELERWTTLIQ